LQIFRLANHRFLQPMMCDQGDLTLGSIYHFLILSLSHFIVSSLSQFLNLSLSHFLTFSFSQFFTFSLSHFISSSIYHFLCLTQFRFSQLHIHICILSPFCMCLLPLRNACFFNLIFRNAAGLPLHLGAGSKKRVVLLTIAYPFQDL
jgi:hypothetical protein